MLYGGGEPVHLWHLDVASHPKSKPKRVPRTNCYIW